jgi:hypothetical protein
MFVCLFVCFHSRVQGSIELDAGEWELMARAKNTEGWSDDRFSREVQIKIPKGELMNIIYI